MTDRADVDNMPGRLDRAVTWTGVGAATAVAALLLMYSLQRFASSEPRANNVGEEGVAVGLGVVSLLIALAVAFPAGWAFGSASFGARRALFRVLPLVVSVAWAFLTAALLPVGLQLVSQMWIPWVGLHQFALFSVFSVGALPIGPGLLIAFLVLLAVRVWLRPVQDQILTSDTPR